ncbi:alpha/beta hydrolase family protein [Tundrisphaera lichenicola]|uniref:alpha/beta hydrolase family protein n=1 Tax=Tundrisphaera lichenicola TaxID=2029860 RepID=UPI003EB927B4
MLRPLSFFGLLPIALLAPLVAAADDPPASLIFTASDLPGLSKGFRVPQAGEYTIKVWSVGQPDWSSRKNELEGLAITLNPRSGAEDSKLGWKTLGAVVLEPGQPVTVVVEKSPQEAEPAAVPALLSFSTSPEFAPEKALDLIRGGIKSTAPTEDLRRSEIRTNQEGADFQPPDSPQAWRDRARAVREQMLVTLGLWPMPPRTPMNPRTVGTLERDGYAIDKVVLETLPGFFLSGNLYRPTNLPPGRRPLVLCPHGHWPEGRVNPDVQSRCIRLAQLGCVVYMYDMVGYADSKPFGHVFLNDRLRRWGLSLPGLQTWNSIRALDYLTSRADVDPARVAVTGESGGATQTLFLTALDDRVKVSAPVVMVSDSFQGGCVCENAAGLRHGTDNVEIAALAAPRPMKIVGATGDWTARTMTNAFPAILQVYGQVGMTDRVSADVFDFPHNYNRTSRDAVYAFLGKWLLGVEDPTSTREGDVKPEKPEDLYAFTTENPYPSDARTADQLENDLIHVLAHQVDGYAPGTDSASWEASRLKLSTALKVRVGIESPTPRESMSKEIRKVERDGLSIAHHVVGRKKTGERIPVVRIKPGHPSGRLTILFTARGKANLTTPEGQPSPIAKALLDRGQSVVGFDPLFVGESLDPADPADHRAETVHYETYNRSLAADRAEDLATVLAWARTLPDVHEISLVAEAEVGPLALLARPALEGLARTAIDLGGFDYGDGSKPVPPGLDLPGVLQFGGLKVAAALTAPAPLRIGGAGESFARTWPVRAYELADSPAQIRIEKESGDPSAIAKWIDSGE